MQTDHRRPLVAYVLVSLAGAFVMAQSVDLGDGGDDRPTFSAFSDTSLFPNEYEDTVVDPFLLARVPDDEVVEEPEPEPDGDSLVPAVDAITNSIDQPLVPPVDTEVAATPSDVAGEQASEQASGQTGEQTGTEDDDAPVVDDQPPADLVVSGGSSGDGETPSGDGDGSSGDGASGDGASGDGDGGAGSPSDPTPGDLAPGDGPGFFDGVPPGGGPVTNPGDGGDHDASGGGNGHSDGDDDYDGHSDDGDDDGEDDGDYDGHGDGHGNGDGDGDGNGDGDGDADPVPHSFDQVPPGAHPYGLVGPRPGDGPKDQGSRDQGSKGQDSRDHGWWDDDSHDDHSRDDDSRDRDSRDHRHDRGDDRSEKAHRRGRH